MYVCPTIPHSFLDPDIYMCVFTVLYFLHVAVRLVIVVSKSNGNNLKKRFPCLLTSHVKNTLFGMCTVCLSSIRLLFCSAICRKQLRAQTKNRDKDVIKCELFYFVVTY
jgi:hypothetical protein